MQDPQRYRGPDGSVYEALPDGTYRRTPPQGEQAPASSGFRLQPMTTPAEARADRSERRQEDNIAWSRQNATVANQRAEEAAARAARAEQRAEAEAETKARGGTPELRGRLALGIGPSVRAVDSMASQHQGVNPLNRDWGATLIDSVPDFGLLSAGARVIGGQDYQDYNQSLKTVESSLLPIFSGMAVTPQEAQRFMKANQPQLGDSPETIQRKTQNVQIILNEGAFLAGREIPYPEVGRYGEDGFRELIAAGDAASVTAPRLAGQTQDAAVGGGAEDPSGPNQPGGSPESPFNFVGASREDTVAAIKRGGWFINGDGEPYQLPPSDPTFGPEQPGDERASPGVIVRPQDQARVDDVAGVMFSPDQVFARSALEQVPLAREAMAGITSAFTGNSYQDTRKAQRLLADTDREQQPLARNMGGVAGGAAIAATPFGAPLRVTRGASLAGRVVNRAAGGSVAGGAWGFGQGEGNALERLPEAGAGAMFGAVAGPAAPVAANALGRVAAPLVNGVQAVNRFVGRQAVNALGSTAPVALREAVQPNALRSGMNRFADRSPQDVNALNTEASRFRAEEIAPAFADVVNDGGRGTMRALATRQTPARQAAREFADGRAAGLQDRVSTQARRTISDDPRQPAQIREEITTRRNRQADQQFGAVRGDRISPDRDIIDALRTPAMRPAIEEAATSAANRGDMETAGALRALAGDALDYGADAQITVGMADRIARSLNGRAEALKRAGNNDAAASHFAIAERLRDGARQQVPGYDQALNAYAQDSGLASATELGEQFMTMEADQFAAAVAKLSPEEQQIAQAAARRAVERQAGTQGQAPGVAQRLSNGREQGARTAALVGDAAPIQRAMGAELQTLRNAQAVSPAQGSPTSMNAQDAMGAAGATLDIATGGIAGLARKAITAIRSRGFNDAEAQAVVEAAIDSNRTDELIGMLAERMSRREARNLARAIRFQLTTGPQSGQQP